MEVHLAQAEFEIFKASQYFQPKTDTSDVVFEMNNSKTSLSN